MAFVGHEVALLFVKVTAWVSPRGIQASAHDLLYAPNRVLATVSQAVQTQGGQHGSFDNDGAGAVRP